MALPLIAVSLSTGACPAPTSLDLMNPTDATLWARCDPNSAAAAMPSSKAVPVGVFHLSRSERGELLMLVRVAKDNCASAMAVARSYEGGPWEASPSALSDARGGFACHPMCSGDGGCTVVHGSSDPFEYRVDRIGREELPGPALNRTVARFLAQTTFGPTRAEVAAMLEATGPTEADGLDITTFAAWIQEQIDLEPTLLREYLRKRQNPRSKADIGLGRVTGPCEINARW